MIFQKDGRAEVYVGVSPRAGVGLTTTLINMAYNAGQKLKTLYVDLDVINPGGTSLLGLEKEKSIWNVITGESPANINFIYNVHGFDVMPLYIFKSRDMSGYLDEEDRIIRRILEKVKQLRKDYDVIFIDTMPGYTVTSIKVWQIFDHLIGVGNHNIQSISSLLQVSDIFREWTERGLTRGFEVIIFNNTGNHDPIEQNILREMFVNVPVYMIPFTKGFYASPSSISKGDEDYKKSLKNIINILKIGTNE